MFPRASCNGNPDIRFYFDHCRPFIRPWPSPLGRIVPFEIPTRTHPPPSRDVPHSFQLATKFSRDLVRATRLRNLVVSTPRVTGTGLVNFTGYLYLSSFFSRCTDSGSFQRFSSSNRGTTYGRNHYRSSLETTAWNILSRR